MPKSAAQRKRSSRAKNPAGYLEEKDKNRQRMAIYRRRNKAQKKARELKDLLREEERREVEAKVAIHKRSLLCDWFNSRNLKFQSEVMTEMKVLNHFVSKIELHKIEHEVAEYQTSLAHDLLYVGPPPAGSSMKGCVGGGVMPPDGGQIPPPPPPSAAGNASTVTVTEYLRYAKYQMNLKSKDQAPNTDNYGARENRYEEKEGRSGEYTEVYTALSEAAGGHAADEMGQCQHANTHAISALLVAAGRMESNEETLLPKEEGQQEQHCV